MAATASFVRAASSRSSYRWRWPMAKAEAAENRSALTMTLRARSVTLMPRAVASDVRNGACDDVSASRERASASCRSKVSNSAAGYVDVRAASADWQPSLICASFAAFSSSR